MVGELMVEGWAKGVRIQRRGNVLEKENNMPTTMTEKTTMKAVRIHAYGGPDVLRLEEVERPEPRANEILVRVHAAGVNPVDWKIREGLLQAPLPMIMGIDFSG